MIRPGEWGLNGPFHLLGNGPRFLFNASPARFRASDSRQRVLRPYRMKPSPRSPAPRSASDAGSGTGSTFETAEAVMLVLLKVKGVASDTMVAPGGATREPPAAAGSPWCSRPRLCLAAIVRTAPAAELSIAPGRSRRTSIGGSIPVAFPFRCPSLDRTLFFAGEATDTSGHNGTVHGAIASGYRAANEVLQKMR